MDGIEATIHASSSLYDFTAPRYLTS